MDSAPLPGARISTEAMAAISPAWASEMTRLHPGQATGLQRAQERGPERAVLAVTDVEAGDFAVPIGGGTGRDDHGLGDDPVVYPGLAVGGVQEHIPERLPGQAPVAERRHLGVQVGADAATSDLEIPLSAPRALTRSSTLRVEVPCRYASMITANRDWSTRRRRSSSDGKNDPARNRGMRSSRSPAVVVIVRGR